MVLLELFELIGTTSAYATTIEHIWILIHDLQYEKRVYHSLPFSNVTLCGPNQRDDCSHNALKN